ncbi:hypothetical protein T459_25602 [Capsicum annuum]|uniref:Uncharacterized protein n=1 Tax=Capsicum annuum TaxID=4072 RepID=A0A2G2YL78_CAPAN|nr:hypothetical protein T459_25602 [Capsicum annuum]
MAWVEMETASMVIESFFHIMTKPPEVPVELYWIWHWRPNSSHSWGDTLTENCSPSIRLGRLILNLNLECTPGASQKLALEVIELGWRVERREDCDSSGSLCLTVSRESAPLGNLGPELELLFVSLPIRDGVGLTSWTSIFPSMRLAGGLFRADFGSQWNRGYYGKQNYGGYGYGASQSQDSMYAAGAAYGAPSNSYGNHQQPVS